MYKSFVVCYFDVSLIYRTTMARYGGNGQPELTLSTRNYPRFPGATPTRSSTNTITSVVKSGASIKSGGTVRVLILIELSVLFASASKAHFCTGFCLIITVKDVT